MDLLCEGPLGPTRPYCPLCGWLVFSRWQEDNSTSSALHIASTLGHPEVVQLLLKARPGLAAVTFRGLSPLEAACQKKNPNYDVLWLLAGAGVALNMELVEVSQAIPE
jgi:hypothetical protein